MNFDTRHCVVLLLVCLCKYRPIEILLGEYPVKYPQVNPPVNPPW